MDFPSHQTMARSPMPMPMFQPLTGIDNPHNNDVLCGRGVTTNRHKGNESFRALVNCNKELYVTSTKKQKMKISRSIVEAVRSLEPPGRFLEKDQASGKWFDIGDKKAVEKTSQALRDGAAGLRKQLSQDLNDPDFLAAVFDMDVGPTEKKVAAAKKDRKAPVKKGHRRVKSNPVVITSTKVKPQAKSRLLGPDIPMSPRARHSVSISMGPPQSPIMSPRSAGGSPRPMMAHSNEFGAYDLEVSHRRAQSQGSTPIHTTSSPVNLSMPRSPRAPPSRNGSFEYYEQQEHRRPPPLPFGSPSHSGHYPPHPMSPSGYTASLRATHPRSPYQQPPQLSPRWSPRSAGYQRSQPSLSPHPYMHSTDYHHRQSPDTRRRQPMSPREHYSRSHPSHPPLHYPPHPHHQPNSHLAVPNLGGERSSSHHQQSHPRRHQISPGRYPPVSPHFHSRAPGSPLPIDFTPPQTYLSRRVESQQYREGSGPQLPIGMDGEHIDEKKDDDHQMRDQEERHGHDGALFDEKPNSSSPAAVADVANSSEAAKENLMLLPPRQGKKDDDYPSDEEQNPADGSVSPLPFDHHEDPSSLMELPENILSLPISPCGPNDGEI